MKERFIFILLLCVLSKTEGSAIRVIGGHDALPEFGKFHASLQSLEGNHVCGGAIISNQHILTAAHCVYDTQPEYIRAVVGTTNLDVGGVTYNVESITINPQFNTTSRANDLALLKINGEFNLKVVEVLKMRNEKIVEGNIVVLTGFGATDAGSETSRQMHELSLPVFNQETCRYAMRYATREVTHGNFCTFSQIGEGTCYGDSGGPLVKNGGLVGLVSWGIPCATGFPDVHTRISPYIRWINGEINNKSCVTNLVYKKKT